MTTFTIHTVESAPAEVKEVLETVQKDNNGYIPNLIGLLANAPTALEAYRTVGAINRRNSLTPVEREVVQITYTGKGFEGNKGVYFRELAQKAQAFTVDVNSNTSFSFTVPQGEYLLLGDDRLVSSDSRHVGTFKASDIKGEAKFRFWPLNRIGTF